jgi:hypothetical protein
VEETKHKKRVDVIRLSRENRRPLKKGLLTSKRPHLPGPSPWQPDFNVSFRKTNHIQIIAPLKGWGLHLFVLSNANVLKVDGKVVSHSIVVALNAFKCRL